MLQYDTRPVEIHTMQGMGNEKHSVSRDRDYQHKFSYKGTPEDQRTMDYRGITAEYVMHRLTGLKWVPIPDRMKKGIVDLGDDVQVRSTHHADGSLLFRTKDLAEHRFILVVTALLPKHVLAVGWLYGFECSRPEWFTDKGDPNRPPQFFVPPDKVRPMETFTEICAPIQCRCEWCQL